MLHLKADITYKPDATRWWRSYARVYPIPEHKRAVKDSPFIVTKLNLINNLLY